MDFKAVEGKDCDSIHMAQKRNKFRALVNTVMKFRFP